MTCKLRDVNTFKKNTRFLNANKLIKIKICTVFPELKISQLSIVFENKT